MKALSKAQVAERDEIIKRLEAAKENFETAIGQFNEMIREQWARIEERIDLYNEIVQEAQDWTKGIADDIQSFMDDKSENWINGDKGQAYQDWQSTFENVDLSEVQIDAPDEVTYDYTDAATELESLETEVNA